MEVLSNVFKWGYSSKALLSPSRAGNELTSAQTRLIIRKVQEGISIQTHYFHKLKRDPQYWKPKKFQHYLTLGELATFVRRDPSQIRRFEREGRILTPARVKRGELNIRLYSPEQAEEIKRYFNSLKRGRVAKQR